MAKTYRINQELKFINLKIEEHDERLYQLHLQCPQKWPSTWNYIKNILKSSSFYVNSSSQQLIKLLYIAKYIIPYLQFANVSFVWFFWTFPMKQVRIVAKFMITHYGIRSRVRYSKIPTFRGDLLPHFQGTVCKNRNIRTVCHETFCLFRDTHTQTHTNFFHMRRYHVVKLHYVFTWPFPSTRISVVLFYTHA
jgi:hypothetical protein